jgi:hypothetical protein
MVPKLWILSPPPVTEINPALFSVVIVPKLRTGGMLLPLVVEIEPVAVTVRLHSSLKFKVGAVIVVLTVVFPTQTAHELPWAKKKPTPKVTLEVRDLDILIVILGKRSEPFHT